MKISKSEERKGVITDSELTFEEYIMNYVGSQIRKSMHYQELPIL